MKEAGAGNEEVSRRRVLRKKLLAVLRTQGKAAKVGERCSQTVLWPLR